MSEPLNAEEVARRITEDAAAMDSAVDRARHEQDRELFVLSQQHMDETLTRLGLVPDKPKPAKRAGSFKAWQKRAARLIAQGQQNKK